MSFTTLKSKMVITRRLHYCLGCTNQLSAGTRMYYWFAVENGTGQGDGSYLCMPCYDYVTQHPDAWDDQWDGIGFGFVNECRHEKPFSVNGA